MKKKKKSILIILLSVLLNFVVGIETKPHSQTSHSTLICNIHLFWYNYYNRTPWFQATKPDSGYLKQEEIYLKNMSVHKIKGRLRIENLWMGRNQGKVRRQELKLLFRRNDLVRMQFCNKQTPNFFILCHFNEIKVPGEQYYLSFVSFPPLCCARTERGAISSTFVLGSEFQTPGFAIQARPHTGYIS